MLSNILSCTAIFYAPKKKPVLCVQTVLLMTVSNRPSGQEVCVKGAQNKIVTGQKEFQTYLLLFKYLPFRPIHFVYSILLSLRLNCGYWFEISFFCNFVALIGS